MKIVKCENGHFYDSDSFDCCPHCGACAGKAQESQPKKAASVEKPHWWSFPGHKKDRATLLYVPGKIGQNHVNQDNAAVKEAPVQEQSVEKVCGEKPMKEVREEVHYIHENPSPHTEHSSLEQEIQKAAGNRDGKTYGYFQEIVNAADSAGAHTPADPVVGWLVAVKGPHLGESYVLHAGKNTIGRNKENTVVLDQDNGVSRSSHATVIYEPKKRDFYLQPGSGSALTYYNGDFIAEVRKMEQRSTIEVGATELLLCMLCGEDFCWEDRIQANGAKED